MTSKLSIVSVLATGVLFCFSSCKSQPEPEPVISKAASKPGEPASVPSSTPPSPPPVMQASPKTLGITWEDPPEWQRFKPRSSARAANYNVPLAAGEKGRAELTVFYFGKNQGGTVESNIDRWVGQFMDVKAEDLVKSVQEHNGLKQHLVEIRNGTYAADMFMGAPHGASPGAQGLPNHALLGAVVDAPSGLYFFKLTGPQKSVLAARAPFFKLLGGATVSEGVPEGAATGKPTPPSVGGASALEETHTAKGVGGASALEPTRKAPKPGASPVAPSHP